MKYDNLPKVLREQGKFCIWKYEERQGQEKPAKVPYQINGKRAQPNNEKTFTDYTSALEVVNRYDGLGIGIFRDFSAIDIDQWFVYDGKTWRSDTGNLMVMNLCKKLANKLMVYALSIEEELLRKQYIKFIKKWQLRRQREIILKDAQDVHPLSVRKFDADIYLLNCQNGTLNLQTGEFRKHRAEDYITKIAGVHYDISAKCPRWERFIEEVMSGDMEKSEFFQKSLGYALTGDTRHEAMFILFGATTRNGKGTSMETFLRIGGDYGRTCRPETIGMKANNSGSAPSEDVARLAGARFVNISEPDKRLTLSAALLKTLTGSDTVNARFLHENSFDFKPQWHSQLGAGRIRKTS